jgi:hypothetical protein
VNPFATHIPLLLACLQRTSGPVLELGCGWFSTPLLSAFATDRLVRTVETDRQWHAEISKICTLQPCTRHRHQIVFVPDYDEAPLEDQQWAIVLLDHEPPSRRGVDALRLRNRCQLMIGHDSQHPDYGYAPVFDTFRYRFTHSSLFPWTTVVSDTDPLDWLEDALTPLWGQS